MRKFARSLAASRVMRGLFWFMAVFALVMALLPKPPATPIDQFGDKVEHMLAFAALTLVALIAWPRAPRRRLAVGLSLFGALIEVLQAIPVLHRDSDPRDWVADTLAILAVMAGAWAIRRIVRA